MTCELPSGYLRIAGGWIYAPLRVGLSLRAPDGSECYFQPGDDTAEILAQIDAIGEIPDERQEAICAMVFGDYFGS